RRNRGRLSPRVTRSGVGQPGGRSSRTIGAVSQGAGGQAGTTTVLFTDLVGSTALRQKLGDDRADDVRRHHDRLLREALSVHGGTEVKAMGDGFMVVFGASAEAVAAAVDMQRAVARFNR